MRLLTSRRVAATAICAALTAGMAGPAVADAHRPPLPTNPTLLAQVTDVLEADGGKVTESEVTAHAERIAAAAEELRQAAKAPVPADMDADTDTDMDTDMDTAAQADALADLQAAIDGLVTATTDDTAARLEAVKKQIDDLLQTISDLTGVQMPEIPIPQLPAQTLPATESPATDVQTPGVMPPDIPVTVLPATEGGTDFGGMFDGLDMGPLTGMDLGSVNPSAVPRMPFVAAQLFASRAGS
ncbi:hypothetical protein [Streptomyces sp. NPDC047928]|uniref:hypothetical protein n=1 Tax=unclassified Streptomyces TaxID=2593676 RepID=UPI003712C8EE